MADEIKASPQSPGLATLARMLRAARSAGDTVTIPYLGGVGTMMLGKAPEEVTEWSYGNAPLHVPAMTRVPQFKKDRAEQLADTLFAAQAAAPVARMAPRAARELAPAAGAIAMRAAEVGGVPVGGLGVIKHKGGNWLAGSVEKPIEMFKQGYVPDYERWGEGAAGVTDQAKGEAAALNKWLETKLAKYIKNEMGTPEDPIRALAEKGITHAEVPPINIRNAHLDRRRIAVGFPAEGMGVSPQAKAWEALADDLIHNLPAGERINVNAFGEESAVRNLKQNPWLAKVPPETMTYGVYGRNLEREAQFGHLIDELRNAVNPESGLPAHLRWKYTDLDKVTVPQAVQRVHDINTWRAEQKLIADQARANNAAAFLHKDYPDAPYKWVELKLPEKTGNTVQISKPAANLDEEIDMIEEIGRPDFLAGAGNEAMYNARVASEIAGRSGDEAEKLLQDALKYEGETMGHCVGGYCPDVMSGKSRIFSLRNKKTGEPHVTVEVRPGLKIDRDPMEFAQWLESPEGAKLLEKHPTAVEDFMIGEEEGLRSVAPELFTKPSDIVQIKGKANRAPKEEYLPFVQDFVRSGKWGDVGDLHNTGLRATRDVWNALELEKIRAAGHEVPEYLNHDEIKAIGDKVWPGQWGDTNYAEGGLVDGATEYNPLEVDYIYNNVMQNYSEGGLVAYGYRHGSNELKGKGYFGELPNRAGGVSTELSAEDDDLGDYPLIVPSLTRSELESLLANERPSDSTYAKARAHARRRKAEGLSPYAQKDELRLPRPAGFAEGGSVESAHLPYDEAKISSLVNALREELNA